MAFDLASLKASGLEFDLALHSDLVSPKASGLAFDLA